MAIVYLILVFLGYATEGPHYQFGFDAHHPIATAKRILIGLGVRFLAWTLGLIQILFDSLFEASAEVGDWLSNHASPETRSRIRSRFI
jgi:hypothetical protein